MMKSLNFLSYLLMVILSSILNTYGIEGNIFRNERLNHLKVIPRNTLFNRSNNIDSISIQKLPFGLSVSRKHFASSQFYSDLIYHPISELIDKGWNSHNSRKIKLYNLPPFKRINFLKVTFPDSDKCINGERFSKYLKVTKYRYRLPNIANYECYYSCDYDPNNTEYGASVRNNCQWCLSNFVYGYLIMYNRALGQATIIRIYFEMDLDDSSYTRQFYIDKDFRIYLSDFSQGGDEDGKGELPTLIAKHILTVSKKGKISIHRIK